MQVILTTIMLCHNQDKMLRSSYRGGQDNNNVSAGSNSCWLCNTRERLKREEKEIFQHVTTSLYIHFIWHPQTIPHAPMYHLNISSWCYWPQTQLLINTTTPHCPMSQHLTPLPYHNKLYRDHLTTPSRHSHISQHLRLSVTLIPCIHQILFRSTLQSITEYPRPETSHMWFTSAYDLWRVQFVLSRLLLLSGW